MKALTMSLLIVILSLAVVAQVNSGFKRVTKNPNAAFSEDFEYVVIRGGEKSDPGKLDFFPVSPNIRPLIMEDGRLTVSKMLSEKGSPIYIEKEVSADKSALLLSPEERFFHFFRGLKSASGIANPESHFLIQSHLADTFGITHVYAIQQYKGIEIYGSEASLHLHADREVFMGRLYPAKETIGPILTDPVLNQDDALAVAVNDLVAKNRYRELSTEEKKLLRYEAPACKLVYYVDQSDAAENRYILSYEIEIRPNVYDFWKYFIDAGTGNILREFNMSTYNGPVTAQGNDLRGVSRTINTVFYEGTYYLHNWAEPMFNEQNMTGVIVVYDANTTSAENLNFREITSPNNTWDAKSVSAMYNSTRTYRYLKETFNRSSINNLGASIFTYINIANPDGSPMDNAFWNGVAIHFGNGNQLFYSIVGALDVVAHELGHAVTQFTANLEYYGQSGAVNESYSDILGAMVDRDNWQIGEDVVNRAHFPSGAMRDMSNPHNGGTPQDHYWQPSHVSEMYIGQGDNGGVHINSSIGNHAFYLFATNTSKEKAEQVFYRALTTYLKKTSQFIDFRISVVQAGKDIWGEGSTEVAELGKAFEAVGIYEQELVSTEQDYPVNPGPEFLLSYDTNPGDPNTLYRSSVTGSSFVPYSEKAMKGKVSVMDDGSYGVFVSSDSRLYLLDMDPAGVSESLLSNEVIWQNVAVSKDGLRVAAITTDDEPAIYVYDFTLEEWAKFELYNPTTSHNNTDAGGVLFADAIEFDMTGGYLLYDAYNVLNSSTVESKYYWDVGIIRVWDTQQNTFGDGRIEKLFGALPEGVSIGNPVFAKNSPHIVAFDYINAETSEYAIFGINTITGDLGLITENSTVGYPSYSKRDNSMAFSALNTMGNEVVASIALAPDKISSAGSPSVIISDAKWPVHYATGTRTLGLAPVSNFTADVRQAPTLTEVQFIDLSINNPNAWNWSFQGGNPSSSTSQNPVVNYASPGTFAVSLTVTNAFGQHTSTHAGFIVIQEATGSGEPKALSVLFYPNPVTDVLSIQCEGDFVTVIYDIHGRSVMKSKNEHAVDMTELSRGLYILEITTRNGRIVEKLVKQ